MSAINNSMKGLSVVALLCLSLQTTAVADETAKPEFHLISTISATSTVWRIGTPLLLAVEIRNQGTNDVQFPNPSQNMLKLHVFVSSSDEKSTGQRTEAVFKFVDEGGASQSPYLELVAGSHTNRSIVVGLPDSLFDTNATAMCNVQVEFEFDLSSVSILPGHTVFRNTLPEKLGEAAHVKSDAEVAAEVQRYRQSGVPVWDLGRVWRGRMLSNTISLSCQK